MQLEIYNCLGERIASLVNKEQGPDSYEVKWNAEGVKPGIYFCRLNVNGYALTQKLIVSQ
ncbi:hypothetical protein ES703_80266 [subsurface metagenome]